MAHALEVREPLMDHPLVEWLASLPSNLKVRGGEGKWLLKKAMEPHLPHDVLYRPKMGFAVPLVRWFRGPLARARAQRAARGRAAPAPAFSSGSYLEHLIDAHTSRPARLQRSAVVVADVRGVPAQRPTAAGTAQPAAAAADAAVC